MHFSIPDTQDLKDETGSSYTVNDNISLNSEMVQYTYLADHYDICLYGLYLNILRPWEDNCCYRVLVSDVTPCLQR